MIDESVIQSIVRAIDVVRVDGRALVVFRAPTGDVNVGGKQVGCASIAHAVAAGVERALPGVCAVVLPAEPGWDVEVVDMGKVEAEARRIGGEVAARMGM